MGSKKIIIKFTNSTGIIFWAGTLVAEAEVLEEGCANGRASILATNIKLLNKGEIWGKLLNEEGRVRNCMSKLAWYKKLFKTDEYNKWAVAEFSIRQAINDYASLLDGVYDLRVVQVLPEDGDYGATCSLLPDEKRKGVVQLTELKLNSPKNDID